MQVRDSGVPESFHIQAMTAERTTAPLPLFIPKGKLKQRAREPISALKRCTSHLTSLRKKEKEKQKEQTKRAREKDRSSYEAH